MSRMTLVIGRIGGGTAETPLLKLAPPRCPDPGEVRRKCAETGTIWKLATGTLVEPRP